MASPGLARVPVASWKLDDSSLVYINLSDEVEEKAWRPRCFHNPNRMFFESTTFLILTTTFLLFVFCQLLIV
uniref:Neur_chan_LBD domain-containing protein n=1 Tax=Steinernema glaseri TaxID=37863 RepID=A0A1I8A7U8_9BILA